MRKYYDNEFNEDYERGFEEGRRKALRDLNEDLEDELTDALVRGLQDYAKNGLTIRSSKNYVMLSSDFLRIGAEVTNSNIKVGISTSANISKRGISHPKTPEEFAIFGRQLSNVNKIYSVCKQIAKKFGKGIFFSGL